MPKHDEITDPNIHEPKGISSANVNEAYFADGAGSGSWKQLYTQGFEDYSHSGGTISLTSGVWTDLANDGAGGVGAGLTYKIPGRGNIWDTVNNQFDWTNAGLVVGDTVDIRVDLDYTANSANDTFSLRLDMAHGHASEFPLVLDVRNLDTAGTLNLTRWTSIYMGADFVVNNPAKLAVMSDTAGDTVQVNGWYVRVLPRNPVLV